MGSYSIKELEKLSGIKAHTLRIWEKRYNIINPDRTDTNIRTYSDDELKKLLNISILNKQGVKISKIASLSYDELKDKVAELAKDQNDDLNIYIDQLTISMVDLDEDRFDKLLSSFILRFGFEESILNILYPFLEKIGVLWLSGNITPVQEHFISNLIRQKIIVAIDGISTKASESAPKAVLFLPEGELHEIGLLFYNYIVKNMGFKAYYLGQYVPLDDLEQVVNTLQPKYLITSVSHVPADTTAQKLIEELGKRFPLCQILATGAPIIKYQGDLPENFKVINNVAHLRDALSK